MARKPNHVDAGTGAAAEATKQRRGLWSPEEDERLFNQITYYGVSTWSSVAQLAGLRRSGKSCRLRWMNYLRPDLRKEPISEQEEVTIISLQKSLGNRWSAIAAELPGRTDNEIKNHWNSHIRKRLNAKPNARQGCSGNSTTTGEGQAAPAFGEKEECTDNAATAVTPSPTIPSRLRVFSCQLLDGGALSTNTWYQQNGRSSDESKASACVGGEDDDCYNGCDGSTDMVHDSLAFYELDYTDDLLIDVPGVMDVWESELFSSSDSRNC